MRFTSKRDAAYLKAALETAVLEDRCYKTPSCGWVIDYAGEGVVEVEGRKAFVYGIRPGSASADPLEYTDGGFGVIEFA